MSDKSKLSENQEVIEKSKEQIAKEKQARREMILSIATGGLCVGLSFVLSQIKLFEMPQGGSVTPASMLPIIFFALSFGLKKGLCASFCLSLLQLIGGTLVSFPQVMFDYIIAFTAVGLAGIFAASYKKRIETANPIKRLKLISFWRIGAGVILAFLVRFFFHVMSGVIFYSEYAGDQNPLVYSIIYNGTFLLVEAAITAVILIGVSVALGLLKVNIGSNKK